MQKHKYTLQNLDKAMNYGQSQPAEPLDLNLDPSKINLPELETPENPLEGNMSAPQIIQNGTPQDIQGMKSGDFIELGSGRYECIGDGNTFRNENGDRFTKDQLISLARHSDNSPEMEGFHGFSPSIGSNNFASSGNMSTGGSSQSQQSSQPRSGAEFVNSLKQNRANLADNTIQNIKNGSRVVKLNGQPVTYDQQTQTFTLNGQTYNEEQMKQMLTLNV